MKKIVCLFIVAILLVCIAGCTQGSPEANTDSRSTPSTESSSPDNAADSDSVDLEVWVRADFYEILLKAADKYMASHPGVTFNIVQPSDMSDQFALALSSGETPDIVSMDCVLIPYYASIGALADITDRFNALAYSSTYSGGLVELAQYEGKQYAVPFAPDVSVMLYNKDHFEAAGLDPEVGPATWDELIEYAQLLTDEEHYGYVFGAGDPGTMMFTYVPYIWSNGGDVMNEDGTKSMLDQPKSVEALQLMCDLVSKYKVCPEGITSYGWTESQDAFLSGKASMIVLGSGAVWSMLTGQYDINAGICLIPSADGENYSSFSGGDSLAIVNDCENVEAAWDFIQYCQSEDVQVEEMAQYGQLPSRSDLFDNKYFEANPEFKVLQRALEVGEAPYSLKYNEMYSPFIDGVQAAVSGAMTAQEAFSKAAEEINIILAE